MALVFKVRRGEPELVVPAKPTPNEVKSLSDWDDREILRYPASFILFYSSPATSSDVVKDPAKTIRRALSEALVYYYPWAGRLKEVGPHGRLVVNCTAEGTVFVEADADVSLDQFGPESLQPPFPCIEELLYSSNNNASFDAKSTPGCPLFVMQVTRLACGGFILAFTFDHVISDVIGAAQFMTAIAELARGALSPSVLPVWRRDLLNARDPPRVPPNTAVLLNIFDGHHDNINHGDSNNNNNSTYRSFFFGADELAAIRALVPNRLLDRCSSFELITACVVHCRVISLQHAPGERVRVVFPVNARHKFVDPSIPSGYYGNASFPATILCQMGSFHDLGNVLEEVKKAKDGVDEEYARSMIDLEAADNGVVDEAKIEHSCTTFCISDLSRVGLSGLDFGWGKPVYAGTIDNGRFRDVVSSMVAYTNEKGEEGRLITLYMDKDDMDRFDKTLRTLIGSI